VLTSEENAGTNTLRLYVNGQPIETSTVTNQTATGDWVLGAGKSHFNGLIGRLDEVAVYTNLLDLADVTAHWDALTPIHYVATDGGNAHPYANWADAATNIQDAVDAAIAGDTVLVSNGTYASGAQILANKAITIESVNGGNVTIVDGQHAHRCFHLGNHTCTISGFTIRNGSAGSGGGVYCSGVSPSINYCTLSGNSAGTDGGGSYRGTLNHCTLMDNSAGRDGGGNYDGMLKYCTLTDNLAGNDGGGVCEAWLNNCMLSGNSAKWGGGSYGSWLNNCILSGNSAGDYGGGSAAGSLHNCTIFDNTAKWGGGSIGGDPKNCIIYYNTATIASNNFHSAGPGGVTNSCSPSFAHGVNGNITNAPLFADAALHLLPNSPCIDAGRLINAITNDLDGIPRPLDGDGDRTVAYDMGAYEFVGTGDSDGDTLNDWEEIHIHGSDPTDTDTDGDGRPDADEVVAGYHPAYNESPVLADGRAEVTANPGAYDLYTSNR